MKKLNKIQTKEKIKLFFADIQNKSPKEVAKMKRLAMKQNIQLKDLKKTFCKKCFTPYKNPKIRIKKGIKSATCQECNYTARWKIK
jgi:RNase P subunit RPR2